MGKNDEHSLSNTIGGHASSGHNLQVPPQFLNNVEYVPPSVLRAYDNNTKRHPKRQIRKLCENIRRFGLIRPILVDDAHTIVAGHACVLAAEQLGFAEVPIIRISHLSPIEIRAFRIADNRLPELGEWDEENLAREFRALLEIGFDVELTGFDAPEIDMRLEAYDGPVGPSSADAIPPAEQNMKPTSVVGDNWMLDDHRLLCGDARDQSSYHSVLSGERAQMVITDPPYNVRIDGNVGGLGAIHHREFPMASGEMGEAEFEDFIGAFVQNVICYSHNGSLHFLFMDWRHLHSLQRVCHRLYTDHINLCVWAKTNGGMGSLYRSQHELIAIYKSGSEPHINNVRLGKYGRNRTNVWSYEGVNTLNPNRRKDLVLHPTVKPVAMIADAIRDCSHRGNIVLDPFIGSGTTIIAAEQTGRRCCGIELDPLYVDVAVRRWEQFTGRQAHHARTGQSFAEMTDVRGSSVALLPAPSSPGDREEA